MAINAAGIFATPEELVSQVYLPGRKGSLQIEMLVAARRHGLVAYELAPRLDDVLREVAAGTPVVVLENYGFRVMPKWHYSVVVGYDLQAGEIVRRSGMVPRQTMPFPVFEYVWKDDGYWAMVAVPPGRVPATATEERYAGAVVALEKSGQPAVARTAYEAMLKRWPTSLAGWMGLGNTAYALKDLSGAEAAFRRAADSHPDSVAALNNLAHVLAERGQIAEARAAAERAVALGGPLQTAARATLEEIHRKSNAAVP
jgi:tetratricopeptide (TPR) repeat protein